MSENRKRVRCTVCGNYTYRVNYENGGILSLVGYYCQHCKMFYPKKGIRIGKDKLYQGLKQVS